MAGGGEGGTRLKRTISRREAGKATLEALRPSPLEVQLTINFGDGKSECFCCVKVVSSALQG